MNFHVLTLFPEMIEQGMNTSITGRAIAKGLTVSGMPVNIRDFAFNKHHEGRRLSLWRRCRDADAGRTGISGAMNPLPATRQKKPRVVYVTPQGQVFNQKMARGNGSRRRI